MNRTGRLLSSIGLALLFVATACGSSDGPSSDEGASGQTFVIGSNNPMTGIYAEFGKWFQQGGDLAVADATAASEDDGNDNTFKMKYLDNGNEAQKAVQNLLSLSNDGVIPQIISGSATLLAMAPVAQSNDAVLVNAAGSTPEMRDASPNLFSVISDSSADVKALVNLAVDDLGKTRVAFVAPDDAQGQGAAEVARSEMEAAGQELVSEQFFPGTSTDLRPQLIKLKDADPDAVLLFTSSEQAGILLKQAAELGIDTQWLGWTAAVTPTMIETAGKAAEGMIGAALPFDPDSTPAAKDFAERYQEKYGEAATIYAALMYDAVRLTAEAIEEKGYSTSGILDYLGSVQDYEGVSGVINFDDDQIRVGDVALVQIEGGKSVPYGD